MTTTANPAESLFAACELAQRAVAGMAAAGASREALDTLAEAVETLRHQHDDLPRLIYDHEGEHCQECEYGHKDLHPGCEPYAQFPVWEWHCKAGSEYQCPIVKGCGFHDPKDPMAGVPNFLKVQAS